MKKPVATSLRAPLSRPRRPFLRMIEKRRAPADSPPRTRPRVGGTMQSYSRSHVTNTALRQSILDRVAREREITAELLADIAEFDERQLYREEGYESLSAWCIGVLHLSKDCAHKRIHAARAARQHPAIFHMVATGRLHLTAVVVLATALKPLAAEAALELLEAAAHKTVEQIELILAGRFPKADVAERIEWV